MRECVKTRVGYPVQYLLLQSNMLKAMENRLTMRFDQEETREEQIAVQLSLTQNEVLDLTGLLFSPDDEASLLRLQKDRHSPFACCQYGR